MLKKGLQLDLTGTSCQGDGGWGAEKPRGSHHPLKREDTYFLLWVGALMGGGIKPQGEALSKNPQGLGGEFPLIQRF